MSDRFKFEQHDDGQIYITDHDGVSMLHAQIKAAFDVEIQVGGHYPDLGTHHVVTIDKLYGPMVFMPIRVTANAASCEWIIERCDGPAGIWREAARIPGQLNEDFTDWGLRDEGQA